MMHKTEVYRENWAVKCISLILFVPLMILPVTAANVFSGWGMLWSWITAFVVLGVVWKPKANVMWLPTRLQQEGVEKEEKE